LHLGLKIVNGWAFVMKFTYCDELTITVEGNSNPQK
jgi:hypothetical protein